MKSVRDFSKLLRAGAVLSALFVFSACGDDSGGKTSKCGAGTVYASVGEVTACYDTCADGVCGVGFRCNIANEICIKIEPVSNNSTNPNNMTVETNNSTNPNNSTTSNNATGTNNTTGTNNSSNNATNNNGTNNPTNNTTNNNPNPQLVALCEKACDLYYGSCITDNCTLQADTLQAVNDIKANCISGGNSGTTCVQDAAADPQFRAALEQLATQTCDDLKPLRCGDFGLTAQCGCATPTNLGAACTTDGQCNGGDLEGFCINALDQDGNPTGYAGGYCAATPCPIPSREPPTAYRSPACGSNGICTVIGTVGDEFAYCAAGCGAGCRLNAGYACQVLDLEVTAANDVLFLRGCSPECTSNADCGTSSRCNLTSGACELGCTTTPIGGTQGNPSLADICLSSGGTCQGTAGSQFCILP